MLLMKDGSVLYELRAFLIYVKVEEILNFSFRSFDRVPGNWKKATDGYILDACFCHSDFFRLKF